MHFKLKPCMKLVEIVPIRNLLQWVKSCRVGENNATATLFSKLEVTWQLALQYYKHVLKNDG